MFVHDYCYLDKAPGAGRYKKVQEWREKWVPPLMLH
jgi:hypothetical protein